MIFSEKSGHTNSPATFCNSTELKGNVFRWGKPLKVLMLTKLTSMSFHKHILSRKICNESLNSMLVHKTHKGRELKYDIVFRCQETKSMEKKSFSEQVAQKASH